MNLRQRITLHLMLYIVLCGIALAQVVEIPDPNLQQAVRETLNLPAGAQITQADMQQLTQLDAGDRQITDLAGLEYANNLSLLALGRNEITDLTPIDGLVKLEHLSVWVNPISDLSPIANLTELKYLDFGYCNTISDISPIESLTNLTLLQLRGNRIVDVSPVKNLTQLVTLRLNDNQIADIGPLENLSELTELHLHNNQIVEVSPLANLTKLTELLLNDNRIVDDSPLANLTNLERLEIHNNPIFDPNSPVVVISDPNLRQVVRETLYLPANASITQANMLQLTQLRVPRDSQIRDLAGMEYATNLTYLALGGNEITDLTPITGLMKLRFLSVWGSPISDLSPITNLTELAHLYLGYCRTVSDIAPVANLTNLTFLQLSRNQVVDISPLENLAKLRVLHLNDNQIADLGPLASLTQLTELHLHDNRIVHVAPLANLTNLEALQLHNNAITDYSPLDGLSLTHFTYDESCVMPPIPLRPRLTDRNFPSIVAAWNWQPVNRPHLSYVEGVALHDLYFTERFGLEFSYAEHGVIVRGYLNEAQERRGRFAALNPNMVFLVAVHIRDAYHGDSPDASPYAPYWVRDATGNPVPGWRGTYLVDFTDPGAQQLIVDQAVAVSKCGLYDGIFLDWWREDWIVLKGHRSFEAEQRARDAILQRIRAEVRPDFLIMVNSNYSEIPKSAPYVNGIFMETGTPDGFRGEQPQGEELERRINKIESTLRWAEENLREPQINGLEGWALGDQPPDSPDNLRWMRAFTTMSLTFSDGYVLLNRGRAPGEEWHTHEHHWYDFWDADLGRPEGEKGQLYQETDGLYIREYTNGWVVYNHSGKAQVIEFPKKVSSVTSGLTVTNHAVLDLDGDMFLKVETKNPADVNGDGIVNILDLILVAQGIGTGELTADVNGDGVVNVFDLVFVANQF